MLNQGRRSFGLGVLTPENVLEGSEYILAPKCKMSHSFIQNCCWITLASFTSSRMKDLVSKTEGKPNFSRRLEQLDDLT